jgi:hypothetical protein
LAGKKVLQNAGIEATEMLPPGSMLVLLAA